MGGSQVQGTMVHLEVREKNVYGGFAGGRHNFTIEERSKRRARHGFGWSRNSWAGCKNEGVLEERGRRR